MREQDLLFQVDFGSLTGRFGQRTQEAARMLAERDWAEFVVSDGYDLEKRPDTFQASRQWVEENRGAEDAQLLFLDNPWRLVRGEPAALREGRTRRAGAAPSGGRAG